MADSKPSLADAGNSLYGALAYNGEKINEAKGRLLTTNRIYNDRWCISRSIRIPTIF